MEHSEEEEEEDEDEDEDDEEIESRALGEHAHDSQDSLGRESLPSIAASTPKTPSLRRLWCSALNLLNAQMQQPGPADARPPHQLSPHPIAIALFLLVQVMMIRIGTRVTSKPRNLSPNQRRDVPRRFLSRILRQEA